MATDEELDRKLRATQKRLAQDNARGTARASLGQMYLEAGRPEEAEKWFLEAARHAEFCELSMQPLVWTQWAVRANPSSLVARREYKRQWEREGMEGDPPALEPFKP